MPTDATRRSEESARRSVSWANGYPLLVIALGVLVAYLVPDVREAGGPLLTGLREFMTAWIPSIDKFAAASSMPGATRNYLSIAWATVPAMSYFNLRLRVVTFERGEVSTNVFAFAFGVAFFSALAFACVLWPEALVPQRQGAGYPGAMFIAVSSSRFWLGVFGAIACWVCSASLACLYRLITNNLYYAWTLLKSRRRSSGNKR